MNPDPKLDNRKKNRKPRTLSRDLILSLVLVVVVASSLTTLIHFLILNKSERLQLEQTADEYLLHLRDSLEFPIWTMDGESVDKIAASFFNNDLVAKLRIIDEFNDNVVFNRIRGDGTDLIERRSGGDARRSNNR